MIGTVLALMGGAALFGGVGYLMLRGGLSFDATYRKALARAARAEGAVIEMRRDTSDSETNFDYPVVRFTTAEGRVVDFEASIRRDPPKHKVGDRVPVYYPPEQPSRADIVGTGVSSNEALVGLGVFCLLCAFLLVWTALRCLFTGVCPAESRDARALPNRRRLQVFEVQA